MNRRDEPADVVDDARFEAEASGRKVELGGRRSALVGGRGELLHRALDNVICNAINHTDPGSTVGVELRFDAQASYLWLLRCYGGPDVPEANFERIFEPFFRGNNESQDGDGLGPTVARRVIEAHGGTIWAANRQGGGSKSPLHSSAERREVAAFGDPSYGRHGAC